jgi:hypothetical protein
MSHTVTLEEHGKTFTYSHKRHTGIYCNGIQVMYCEGKQAEIRQNAQDALY